MDTVDGATRSKIMSSVGQKDTGAELLLRSALHRAGIRFRLYDRSLPGSPDLVLPRYRAVIFVHGCYWHSHNCYRATVPKSRRAFWKTKFEANRTRDERKRNELLQAGWRVLTVWECALRGKSARSPAVVAAEVRSWLRSRKKDAEIAEVGGRPRRFHINCSRNAL
jgi:DNA mismatch endonuclease, patch repair protein